jgi:hypothetical protein
MVLFRCSQPGAGGLSRSVIYDIKRASEKFYAAAVRLRMSRVAAMSIIDSDVWTRNS